MATTSSSSPRKFSKSGFATLDTAQKIEEETLPFYNPENYHPVYIGELFKSRYQVVGKLGYGVNSTVWLCKDLKEMRFLTLKMRVRAMESENIESDQETKINEYLASRSVEHPGRNRVRSVVDSFQVFGPKGKHKCMLYQPLGMSFTEFLRLLPQNKFSKELTQKSTQLILIALDYLHKCDVVHTDISPNNILQGIEDISIFAEMDQEEIERPIARKILCDRIIYNSRPVPFSAGQPVLCDLGDARVGARKFRGDIMPGIYRAPEVILGMGWDSKVDVWAIGIMTWDLLEGNHLFTAQKNGTLDDEQHLAEMVSLLGTPPLEFLERSPKCSQYWDNQGNWKGSVPIRRQSFEAREQWLDADDRALLVRFLRRVLCWMPEDRPTDDFLMQPYATQFEEASKETLT